MGRLCGNAARPKQEGAVLPTQMGRDGKGLQCCAGIWEGGQKCKRGSLCVCTCACVTVHVYVSAPCQVPRPDGNGSGIAATLP